MIEDLDTVPFEVMSSLVPLMESRRLLLPNRPAISAAPGFRLIGTRTTRRTAQPAALSPPADDSDNVGSDAAANAGAGAGAGAGSDAASATAAGDSNHATAAASVEPITGPLASFVNSWCRVAVGALPHTEVRAVINARHAGLPDSIVDSVVATSTLLLGHSTRGRGSSGEGYHSRVLSVRNVLRWAARIAKLARFGRGLSGYITEDVRALVCLRLPPLHCRDAASCVI